MTFFALLVSLIVLLILAGVSLSAVFSEKGIFNRAENATSKYSEAKAKEILETILMADAQTEKYSNPKYNQDDFLDDLIKKEIPETDIKGDVVIIEGWAFELDRSVPKIGHDLGQADKLVFPEVNATVKLAEDKKNATIEITAIEETNGINKIEIWQLGEKIKEYTYEDEEIKKEITISYTAKQNGDYTIKAYGKHMDSKKVTVEGIVSSVRFEPNGSEEWKQSHITTVTIQETADKVVSAKYYWINSVTEPTDDKFTEEHSVKSGDTITGEALNGTNYLWVMLETQSGEKLKWRSEGFNFDNQGPTVTLASTGLTYSSFKLNLTAIDEESGIDTYEFFVGGVSQGVIQGNGIRTEDTKELTIDNATYGDTTCYVIVTDKLGNPTRKEITAKTLLDTTGPNITTFTVEKYSIDGMTLKVTAQDTGTGIVKFEFYIDGVKQDSYTQTMTATTSGTTKTVNITGLSTGSHNCKVMVYDKENNNSNKTASGTTKLYAWEVYNFKEVNKYTTLSSGWKKMGSGGAFNANGGETWMDAWRSEPQGCYLFKTLPMWVYNGTEDTIESCNGVFYNSYNVFEIASKMKSGGYTYVVAGSSLKSYGGIRCYSSLVESNSSNCTHTSTEWLNENEKTVSYKRTSSTGDFVTSTNKDAWENNGYKNGKYTVKVDPR